MVCLKMQKRIAAKVMKCGRRKVWMDPNEKSELAMASTRHAVRKLIRDGFIIKKPKKIHSRFRARRRKVEKKKGRHLGQGSRKGSANARCSTQMLWRTRMRAMRRLLKRYYWAGTIDRRMYHRYYLKAKGNAYRNKENLVNTIATMLSEKKRGQQLLEQYKVRREEANVRKLAKEKKKQRLLDEQLELAEQAEQIRLQQEREAGGGKKKKAKKGKKKKEEREEPAEETAGGDDQDASGGKKRKRKRGKKGKAATKEATPEPQPEPEQDDGGKKKKRRRRKKKGDGDE